MSARVQIAVICACLLLAGCPRFADTGGKRTADAAADATFVEVDGIEIHYRELGKADDRKTVVLVHGFGASLESWRGVHEVLARHFRVIAIDLVGFGRSGRPAGGDEIYGPTPQAQRAWRALDRLGVGDAALVGHSWGSSVVLAMALEQPQRVRRVALYSAYVFEDQVPGFFRWSRLGGVGELLFGLFWTERIEDRVALAYHDEAYATQERVERVEAEMSRDGGAAAALAAARAQRYEGLERRWREITAPTLLVWGDDDQVTPLRFGERLARELPDATLKVYAACGHVPMVEARVPTTRDVLAFLRRDLGETAPRVDPADVPELVTKLEIEHAPPLHAAADLAVLGAELAPRKFSAPRERVAFDVHGALRLRGESLYNLDLDRGLDPSGQPLFPVPLDGGQRLDGGDMRLRTDVAAYAPGTGVAVKMRIDVLDNVALGSTPDVGSGRAPTPAASPGQVAPDNVVRVERAWGEALTPFGVVAAGRMGAHWGLGIAANGGDCDDCDGGDAADRIAFVAPLFGSLWAVSYDFTWSGPVTARKDAARTVELAPADDVSTVTLAWLRTRSPNALVRRAAAGLATFEAGAFVSHRWQAQDVPAAYLPVATPVPLADPMQLVARDFSATTAGAWLRIVGPRFRVEAEGVLATARVGQPSLVPGVELTQAATSRQLGLAVETEARLGAMRLGVDAGFASGDDAPGFGAFPAPGAAAAQPGDLDGPQADPPGDTTVDNFRFHPDYRVDRILFREIIGTVTDAAYLRPHVAGNLLDLGHAWLEASAAVIASWAIEPTSTPTGARALGIELDPSLTYVSRDGFRAALDYALLLPGAAFEGDPAQLVRLRLGYVF